MASPRKRATATFESAFVTHGISLSEWLDGPTEVARRRDVLMMVQLVERWRAANVWHRVLRRALICLVTRGKKGRPVRLNPHKLLIEATAAAMHRERHAWEERYGSVQ
jgi:hypothetical protein